MFVFGASKKPVTDRTVLLINSETYPFIDSSANPTTVTDNGFSQTSYDNGQYPKFGSTFIKCPGSNYLRVYSPKTDLGTKDFTLDFWWTCPNDNGQVTYITNNLGNLPGQGWGLQIYNNIYMRFGLLYNGGGSLWTYNIDVMAQDGGRANGQWKHLAAVRNGTSLKLYHNGSSVGSTTIPANINITTTDYLYFTDATGAAATYYEEFKLSNYARWTANFTPPTGPST